MKIIKVDFKKPDKKNIELIAHYFKSGKIVVYPTDTIYGIGCDATNKKSIQKIWKIKKRDKNNPFLVLIKSWFMLRSNFYVSVKQNEYLRKIWFLPRDNKKTRPTTVLLKKRKVFPDFASAGKENVAVRLPNNKFLIKMMTEIGRPIVSTSVNESGKKPLENIENIDKYFNALKPDLVVDIGRSLKGKSSKLVDLLDIKNKKILRK